MKESSTRNTASASHVHRVERARSGDVDAFASLYHDYRANVFRYTLARMRNPAQAEDITSETFIRAFQAIHNFTPTHVDIGAWFITIARNLTVDYAKSACARREWLVDDVVGWDRAVVPSAEDQVLQTARYDPLRQALLALPSDLREALVLQYWAGWPKQRIARRMKRPTAGAVKSMRNRAIQQLRTSLDAGTFTP
ncbi:RNA polymerase sigma factor [Streptomyces meridianus]|uniref:RNA polymerase sigma factor n=1 Tax=Streptomyces meridianus TaxID=2938945 RepID=A0ABT0X271_9ACTN|nr:RNA polymerase sigma factor [Streptomyces meridianus]MCM2576643.1 RNA polymerase sigma factor [Streptomyces meridianus]